MARPGSWGLQVDRPDHDQADLDQQQREHAQPGRAGCLLVLTLVGPIWAVQPISGPRPQCDPTPRSPQEPTSRASGSQSTLVSARHEKSRYARTTAPRPRLPGGALSFMADVWSAPRPALLPRTGPRRTVWPIPQTRKIGGGDTPAPAIRALPIAPI